MENSADITVFMDAKMKYFDARKNEFVKIRKYLKTKGWVVKGGGQGNKNYGKNLKKKYDLSNWKYIEATMGDISIHISLQAFDQDKKTKNFHVLMDRIGLCIFPANSKPEYISIMDDTPFDLPLNESDIEDLYQYIVLEVNKFIAKRTDESIHN